MTKLIMNERLPMELNLGSPERIIGWATISRDTETKKTTIEIELGEYVSEKLTDLAELCELKAIGFAGIIRRTGQCECGHDLSAHIPRPEKLFAWPCSVCECSVYEGSV